MDVPGSRAQGGPVQAGKPYVVGEEGPEIIIPKSDGNVLTNDDSQIYAMLLAANPQLQKVSRQRAEKFLEIDSLNTLKDNNENNIKIFTCW